jgi:prepilin-type N-terminal cleavage/methylation domain-containing protein
MRTGERGFSLIELIVASAVFTIFAIGLLNLLDTSTRVAQIESSLADTQENVRFAAYHIMRTARMMGGADMPFAGTTVGGGGDQWVTGELISNASGTIAIPGFGNVTVLPGSDVLTLRGFFEIRPFSVNPQDAFLAGAGTVSIAEYNLSHEKINDVTGFTLAALEGRGVVFMGRGNYCVGELDSGSGLVGEDFDRKLVLQHKAGDTLWPGLNTDQAYPPASFDVYRVGILESYTYFVSPDNVLRRVRVSGDNPQAEPVAINIGGLQIAVGVDSNDDGTIQPTEWNDNPSGAGDVTGHEVLGMRIAVLGRTEVAVPGWTEPDATFEVEDGTSSNMQADSKWRRIELFVNLRNYSF